MVYGVVGLVVWYGIESGERGRVAVVGRVAMNSLVTVVWLFVCFMAGGWGGGQ